MMDDTVLAEEQEATRKAHDFALAQAKNNMSRSSIVSSLVDTGMDPVEARKIVNDVFQGLSESAESEKITLGPLIVALVAAGMAALVGGALWGLIVIWTDYEIGYMATGIGLLTGFAVVFFSGKRGFTFQTIAVVAALAGITIGKYVAFYAIFKELVAEEFGAAAASYVTLFSVELIQIFIEAIPEIVSPYDILWIILAVIAAWSVPKGSGWKPVQRQ